MKLCSFHMAALLPTVPSSSASPKFHLLSLLQAYVSNCPFKICSGWSQSLFDTTSETLNKWPQLFSYWNKRKQNQKFLFQYSFSVIAITFHSAERQELFSLTSRLYLVCHQVLLTATSRSSSHLPFLSNFLTTPVIQVVIFDLKTSKYS